MGLIATRLAKPDDSAMSDTIHRLAENPSELAGRLAQIAEQSAVAQNSVSERPQVQERAITKMLMNVWGMSPAGWVRSQTSQPD